MSKKKPAIANGYVIIDKPVRYTSHDVVAEVRNILRERRVGHSGTLDPDATGVLLLGIGYGTKLLRFSSTLEKSYVGDLVLGTATSTLDASGEITGTFDMDHITISDVQGAAEEFVGDIEQLPPMVSAIRVDGKRLYTMARDGSEVERTARPVHVSAIEISPSGHDGIYRIAVRCSSGTYVRSIADDIGRALGGGAHLRSLRRVAIGSFHVDNASHLDALTISDVRPASGLVGHLESFVADGDRADAISHGKVFALEDFELHSDGPWAFYDGDQSLLGVYEKWRSSKMKPAIVLYGSYATSVDTNE